MLPYNKQRKMEEWKIILISLFSSTSIVTAIIFMFKKSFEKAIDLKFSKVETETKLELEEVKRRQAKIFDKIFEAEKLLLSSIYESRNLIKYELLNSIDSRDIESLNKIVEKLNSGIQNISGILISERIIIPEEVFKLSHDYKHKLFDLHSIINRNIKNIDSKEDNLNDIKKIIEQIDSIYASLSKIIVNHYGNFKIS